MIKFKCFEVLPLISMDNTSIYTYLFLTQCSHIESRLITLLIAQSRTTKLFVFRGMLALKGDCHTQPHFYSDMLTYSKFFDKVTTTFFIILKL